MSPLTAVVGCAELVTCRGPARPRRGAQELHDIGVVRDGAFLVADGRFAAVGTRAEIEPQIPAGSDMIDAGGRVVMPGFVDAHTHAVFAGTRANETAMRAAGLTYLEIAKAGGGIRSTVRATRAASEDELVNAAGRYEQWFYRSGTTTVEAKSGYGLTVADEVKLLRAIRRLGYIPTFLGAHIVPDEYRGRAEDYVDLVVNEMLPRVSREGLAEYCDVFCEDGAFSPEQAARILTAAASLGLKPRIHADQLSNGGGAQLAARVGAVTADHLEHTDAAGIDAMRAAGVQPVLLPGSVYGLGSARYPAARAMIDAGLGVVLATDFNPGTSPTTSMLMVLSLAVTHMRMLPAEAVTAATINAAYGVGRGSEAGSIEAGKRADFVVYDCSDYREVAYFFGVEHASATYKAGRPVFRRDGVS